MKIVSVLLLGLMVMGTSVNAQKNYGAETKTSQAELTPEKAFERLKEGNDRYVNNKLKRNKKFRKQAPFTAKGQYPFATILSCIDSRVTVEEIFDLGNGDAFSGRVAGNVATPDLLGSFEFATKLAGSKVLVVLGHTSCGAVKGACDKAELGNLTGLLDRIKPAVDLVSGSWSDGVMDSKNSKFVEAVSKTNVKLTIEKIKKDSPVMNELIDSGKLLLVGGIYNLETGRVTFMD